MGARSVRQSSRVLAVVAVLLCLAAARSGDDDDSVAPSPTSAPAGPPTFTMVELAAEANGPAGVLPIDLDGDGRLELVVNEFGERPDDVGSAEYFYPGASSVWFENTTADPAEPGPFERHAMTDELGRAIELAVIPDLLGDGADGWVGSNHVNTATVEPEPPSMVSLLSPPADPTQAWTHRPISEGIESPCAGHRLPTGRGRCRGRSGRRRTGRGPLHQLRDRPARSVHPR